ncbi:fungal-specific transcription factor domain-containing protein [Coniochaeta sp. 2T2.1]|nr:fungal-specific transcription factor domain-containing protein [Coniochaeta sp. 2T2.1]
MDEETSRKRVRVSIACKNCRNRKSRCDGRCPTCKRCEELGTVCTYDQPPAARPAARPSTDSELLSRLHALEAKIQSLAQTPTSQADTVVAATGSDTPSASNNNNNDHTRPDYAVGDAPAMSGIVTPPRDNLPVDGMGEVHLTEATEDSTYFGTSSNAAFIRQLSVALAQAQIAHRATRPVTANCRSSATESQATAANMRHQVPSRQRHTHDIVAASRTSSRNGPGHHVPQEPEATSLINTYLTTIGLFFPCIHADTFLDTYKQMRKNNFVGARRLWLALLYMMIASVYQCESPSSPTEQLAEISECYFQWAKELAMPEMLISSNLETVQLLCLMIAYLHGSSQSAQLWTIHCLTVKAAVQMGLHSPNASKGLTLLEREMRKRTWFWCIINDDIVSVKLGRPMTISPTLRQLMDLPVDINDIFTVKHSSRSVIATSLSAYKCEIQLSRIACDVLSQLYGDNAGSLDDLSVFDSLKLGFEFSWKLSEWQQSVPEERRPRNVTGTAIQPVTTPSLEAQRFQAVLGLRYHGLCALVQRPALLKFLGFEPNRDGSAGQLALLRDSGIAGLRRCIRSCRECIALAKAIVDHWQDHRVLLSGAWWLTAYHSFGTSLTLFGILLVSTKSPFSDLLSADEIRSVRSSLGDASELLSRFTDTLVISRCHDCLENFLHLYDQLDALRGEAAVTSYTAEPAPDSGEASQAGDGASGFGTLPTGAFHDPRYDFASFDMDTFNRPVLEFSNFDWGGSLG